MAIIYVKCSVACDTKKIIRSNSLNSSQAIILADRILILNKTHKNYKLINMFCLLDFIVLAVRTVQTDTHDQVLFVLI